MDKEGGKMNQFKEGDRVVIFVPKEYIINMRGNAMMSAIRNNGKIGEILQDMNNDTYIVKVGNECCNIVSNFLKKVEETSLISPSAKENNTNRCKGENDIIEHPAHYTQGIECMDYIESHKLNYARGNIIKYVTRAGLKDESKEVEDLEKARWYLDREIEQVKKAKNNG